MICGHDDLNGISTYDGDGKVWRCQDCNGLFVFIRYSELKLVPLDPVLATIFTASAQSEETRT